MRIYEGPTGTSNELKYSFDEFTTRPSIRFESSERPDSPTTSKVCGTPYLPEYAPYPYRSGEPMYFIAQFNFSEFDPLPGFPTTGLLQLFVSDDDMWGDNYRDTVKEPSDHEPTQNARYLPDTTKPHVGEVPESVLDSGDHPAIDPLEATTISGVRTDQFVTLGSKEFNTYAFSPRKPHALLRRDSDLQTLHTFRGRIVSRRVIGDQEEICTTRAWTDDKSELQAMFDSAIAQAEQEGFALDPSADQLLQPAPYFWKDSTRLGGYSQWINDCILTPGDPRVSLASVSHDGNLMFGDCGCGNFFIHPDDLAARNFDRVIFGWDCG